VVKSSTANRLLTGRAFFSWYWSDNKKEGKRGEREEEEKRGEKRGGEKEGKRQAQKQISRGLRSAQSVCHRT
jgi:hypothetical protein